MTFRNHGLSSVWLWLPVMVLLAFAYAPAWSSFYAVWTDENNPGYSHGLVLLAIVVYLVIRQGWSIRAQAQLEYSWLGALSIWGFSVVWSLSRLGNVQAVELVSVIFLLVAVMYAFWGMRRARRFVVPLLFLLLAVPVWDFLNIYLRTIASVSVPVLLNNTGISTLREGFQIIVPAGVFKVDAGCSGLNQFIVAGIISLLYAYMIDAGKKLSALLLLSGLGLAVIANVLRIFIVIAAGELSDMQHYLVTKEHVSLGWVVFAVAMTLFFWLAVKLERTFKTAAPAVERVEESNVQNLHMTPAASAVEQVQSPVGTKSGAAKAMILGLSLSGIVAGPVLVDLRKTGPINLGDVGWPTQIEGWSVVGSGWLDWQPVFRGADLQYSMVYRKDEHKVYLHVFHYHQQAQGKEAINSSNRLSGGVWNEIARGGQQRVLLGQRELHIEEYRLRSLSGRERIAWSWYYVNGEKLPDPRVAKVKNILAMLRGVPAISSFAVAVDRVGSEAEARATLKAFLQESIPALENVVDSAERQVKHLHPNNEPI